MVVIHMSLWYSSVLGLSLSSVVSFSLSLSCTLPRTTDRDLDVLTSFHLAQEKQVVIYCHLRGGGGAPILSETMAEQLLQAMQTMFAQMTAAQQSQNRSTYRAAEDGTKGWKCRLWWTMAWVEGSSSLRREGLRLEGVVHQIAHVHDHP